MGVGGAAKLINSAVDDPQASAARMFPSAAAANRSIFYDKQGSARSVSEVYAVINGRYASAAGSSATQTALAMYGMPAGPSVAAASPASATGAAQAVPALDSASFLSQLPDVRKAPPVTVAAAADVVGMQKPIDPMFRSLFQADDGAQAVSPTVQALWGNSGSLTSNATPGNGASSNTASAPAPLDLFSDRSGTFSNG